MIYKVACFDPGITTGTVSAQIHDNALVLQATQHQWTEKQLWDQLDWSRPNLIIYEGFNYRNRARKGLELFPVRIIGVLNLYAQASDCDILEQPPGTGFERYSDDELKRLGHYIPARPHAMDALRHFLYWWNHGPGYRFQEMGK